jgi:DNA-nicking Smr family endonuclease
MGIKDRKHNNSEDRTLFRGAAGAVQPVSARPRHVAAQTPGATTRRRHAEQETQEASVRTESEATTAELVEGMSFQRNSVSRKRMKELRRGKLSIGDEIDLHGCTRREAKPLLQSFIHDCARNGLGCVRVVHGKGMRSGPDGPVLKTAVNHWLREWEPVLAFCPARSCDGGGGAIYVLLKEH